MCKLLEVSKSGYYSWVGRMDQEEKDQWLADLITLCQEKSKNTYGYRRVKEWLWRKYGLRVNHKAVLRVMGKYNLLSEIRRHRRYKRHSQALHRYPNLFNRNFAATNPNQKWVTDISYVPTRQGMLYLSVIKDLHDGFIIHYEVGTSQTVGLVSKTIRAALKKEVVADGLALHSDQGSQYTSNEYLNLSQEYGFTPSMSRRGNCYDNACIESFFGTLKAECLNRLRPDTLHSARIAIDDYIQFYNYERIQLKTKLTPYERRCQAS